MNNLDAQKIRNKLDLSDSEWLRRLVPEELEMLNMFPKGHTEGQSDSKRAFMGNALVIGIVSQFGKYLLDEEIK